MRWIGLLRGRFGQRRPPRPGTRAGSQCGHREPRAGHLRWGRDHRGYFRRNLGSAESGRDRAREPRVRWPSFHVEAQDENLAGEHLRLRLHSDGPGLALDVRWSIYRFPEPGRTGARRADEELAARASTAVRGLRPGESYPASTDVPMKEPMHPLFDDEPWSLVVRWSDSAGRRWQFSEWSGGRELASRPLRVRQSLWAPPEQSPGWAG